MAAPLRDIFNYTHTGRANLANYVNNSDMSDEDFYRSIQQGQNSDIDFHNERSAEGDLTPHFTVRPGSFLERIQQQYGNPYSMNRRPLNGESAGWDTALDDTKLPQTRFGGVNRVMPVDSRTRMNNSDMQYEDENYGQITHQMNYNSGNDVWKNIPMMLATMGFGQLPGMAAWALPSIRGVQGIAQGQSPLGFLANMGMSQLGLPPWAKLPMGMLLQQLRGGQQPRG
jgi:hypothetical protein